MLLKYLTKFYSQGRNWSSLCSSLSFLWSFFVRNFSSNFLLSQVKGVVGDLEYAESDLADSTETRSLNSSDEGHEKNQEDSLEAAAVYKQVEAKPPVQFGLNNKNLDLIYSGHQPWAFGLALRKWIFGVNGLAYEMILPTKQKGLKRTCVSMEKMLVFLVSFALTSNCSLLRVRRSNRNFLR